MTSSERPSDPNHTQARRDYIQEWLHHPTDPAGVKYDEDGKRSLEASQTQIEAARREMGRELYVKRWSETVRQYPRTVVGKFVSAPDDGFNEVGIEGGQDRGVFTNRQPLRPGSDPDRLMKILSGGEGGYDAAAKNGVHFLIDQPSVQIGDKEVHPLTYLQYQNKAYTAGGHRGSHTPLITTFYLPPREAQQLLVGARQYPDVVPGIFEGAVAWGLPERVYRTPAQHLGILNQDTLRAAEASSGYKSQQFDTLWKTTQWHKYAEQHGGEIPETRR